jgi:hypothetical protein
MSSCSTQTSLLSSMAEYLIDVACCNCMLNLTLTLDISEYFKEEIERSYICFGLWLASLKNYHLTPVWKRSCAGLRPSSRSCLWVVCISPKGPCFNFTQSDLLLATGAGKSSVINALLGGRRYIILSSHWFTNSLHTIICQINMH